MKMYRSVLAILCVIPATGFTVQSRKASSRIALWSTPPPPPPNYSGFTPNPGAPGPGSSSPGFSSSTPGAPPPSRQVSPKPAMSSPQMATHGLYISSTEGDSPLKSKGGAKETSDLGLKLALDNVSTGFQLFPPFPSLDVIQGGGTVYTYQMPPWADRCQMLLMTNGRPMKARVECWIGPLRTVHRMEMDVENGLITPVQEMIKFKKLSPVIKISATQSVEFPMLAGVFVPSPDRSKVLEGQFDNIWENANKQEKQVVQGGSIDGGAGALRYWQIPAHVESVQVLAWSRDTGKKSFRFTMEVLQGPNNKKQDFTVQCGGSTQPYHGVFQTPGDACVILCRNKKYLEDGLVQICIVPYHENKDLPDFI